MVYNMKILLVEYLTERIVFFIERFGKHRLNIAESSEDAIFYLKESVYDYIFLGGNLSQENDNCFKVAEFLAGDDNSLNIHPNIIMHSWNAFEVEKMLDLLPNAMYLPYDEYKFSTFDF